MAESDWRSPAPPLARTHQGGRARPRPCRARADRPAARHGLPEIFVVGHSRDLDARAVSAISVWAGHAMGEALARPVELLQQREEASWWRRGGVAIGQFSQPGPAWAVRASAGLVAGVRWPGQPCALPRQAAIRLLAGRRALTTPTGKQRPLAPAVTRAPCLAAPPASERRLRFPPLPAVPATTPAAGCLCGAE